MSSLPDEIIAEILSPALKISDETFSDTQSISPFASYSPSTSAFLLVCKGWLRVSTPLLYNTVVIRSKAQAHALETALKSNHDLGIFIKKLRIEGGYGSAMKIILQFSPNITDLVVSLAIYSSDAVAGLCQGLHSIDPVRLIIHDMEEPRNNKQNVRLVKTVSECIQLWKNLRIVDLPYEYDWEPGVSRCSQICAALVKAPFMEELVIPVPFQSLFGSMLPAFAGALPAFGTTQLPSFIADVRANPVLKTIQFKQPLPANHHIIEIINADPGLKELIQFSVIKSDQLGIRPSLNPSFVPLESASPDDRDNIWGRILYFALEMDVRDAELASDVHMYIPPSVSDRMVPPNSSTGVSLVSQQFRRISLPYYYRHLYLSEPGDMGQLSAALLENPAISQQIKSLGVEKEAFDDAASIYSNESDDGQNSGADTEELMQHILSRLRGLVSLTGAFYDVALYPPHPQITDGVLTITWATFQTLGTAAGRTLRRFCVQVVPPLQPQSHLAFQPFLALRSLEWKCLVEFDLDPQPLWAPGTLANLECLFLVDCHPSFLTLLTTAELPSLRRVYFHRNLVPSAEDFLRRHSSKLAEVSIPNADPGTINVLNACPGLPVLIFYCDEMTRPEPTPAVHPSITLLSPSEPHTGLSKIVLEAFLISSRKDEKSMRNFLESLDTEMLPALREIQVFDFHWPTTERDIAKDFWVSCAESLLKKNMKITDEDGKHWTPRLKTTGSRRKVVA